MDKEFICAAADEETVLGLSLGGVKDTLTWEKGDAPDTLGRWYRKMSGDNAGIMILSRDCAGALKEELFRKRTQRILRPIVVVLPGKGEDPITEGLIRRAIGMNTRSEGDLKESS